MVKSGQQAIRSLSFRSSLHPELPVEVLTVDEASRRIGPDLFVRPERLSFTMLMFVDAGTGSHTVDFRNVQLVPGQMLRISPGQLQAWKRCPGLKLTLVISAVARDATTSWTDTGEPARTLDAASRKTVAALIDGLRAEQRQFAGDEASVRLMRQMFETINAVFERAQSGPAVYQLPEAYVAYRNAIEENLGETHHVSDYALSLGFSARTVSRACLEVTGRTAKRVLTDRLVLEAKRLLVHTDLTAGTIARQLGFAEATNFQKFFTREVGALPSGFRSSTT